MNRYRKEYETPNIDTVDSNQILEFIGPVQGYGGGSHHKHGGHDRPWWWWWWR